MVSSNLLSIFGSWCVIVLSVIAQEKIDNQSGSSLIALRRETEALKRDLLLIDEFSLAECGRIRKLNGTLRSIVPSLLQQQQDVRISEAIAYADLLRRKLVEKQQKDDDAELVLGLLRSFLGFNRILTEIGFVKPSISRRGEMKQFQLFAAWRSTEKGSALTKQSNTAISNLSIIGESNVIFHDWKLIYLNFSIVQRTSTQKNQEWLRASDQSQVAMKKHCSATENASQKAQWLVMVVLKIKEISPETSPSMFYLTFPLNAIDLNQCDDSPNELLRSTHGCTNATMACVFIPGGGFELGNYQCCCLQRNGSSTGWLGQREKRNSLRSRELLSQQYEQCVDGSTVEREAMFGRPYPGRCLGHFQSDLALRRSLVAINILSAAATFALIFVVTTQRKVKDWGARGWALMEFFLIGAILIYCIVILEYFEPSTSTCCLIPWCRELGFALFYGSVVLKIHRNLFEHGVRKANYVFIKEKDLLKYLLCIVAFTLIGLLAWTVTAMQAAAASVAAPSQANAVVSVGRTPNGNLYMVCTFFHWNLIWHTLEFGFLSYGAYLSWKTRMTSWNEKNQFAIAVVLEMVVSLIMIIVKKQIWLESSPDTLLLLSFFHAHTTVTVVVTTIMATKLYYARLAPTARDHSTASSGVNRMHPSLAKLRDNLMNGTIDFADMPIGELNPEDIRAELKRVYTQLRMYKLTNLYMDNPHISKRKGGKKTSNKQTNRRISIPNVISKPSHQELTNKANVMEVDERSSLTKGEEENNSGGSATDLTVQTSPHNIYFTKSTAAKRIKIESELSVCI